MDKKAYKSIIGKKYISRDNSYEINLTKPIIYHKEVGHSILNREYLSLNKIECTIVTEPFKMLVYIRDKMEHPDLDSHGEKEMVLLLTPKGDTVLQLYYDKCIIK